MDLIHFLNHFNIDIVVVTKSLPTQNTALLERFTHVPKGCYSVMKLVLVMSIEFRVGTIITGLYENVRHKLTVGAFFN